MSAYEESPVYVDRPGGARWGATYALVYENGRLSTAAKALYGYLCTFASAGPREAYPTIKTLAYAVGSTTTVERARDELVAEGYLTWERRRAGRVDRCYYYLLDEQVAHSVDSRGSRGSMHATPSSTYSMGGVPPAGSEQTKTQHTIKDSPSASASPSPSAPRVSSASPSTPSPPQAGGGSRPLPLDDATDEPGEPELLLPLDDATDEPLLPSPSRGKRGRGKRAKYPAKYPAEFEALWSRYPRNDGKARAYTAFRAARKARVPVPLMQKTLDSWLPEFARRRPDRVPWLSTWLNDAPWETLHEREAQTRQADQGAFNEVEANSYLTALEDELGWEIRNGPYLTFAQRHGIEAALARARTGVWTIDLGEVLPPTTAPASGAGRHLNRGAGT